jgi:transcription elongation factor SPT5
MRPKPKKPTDEGGGGNADADALTAAVTVVPKPKTQRPPARLFSRAEAEKAGVEVTRRRDKSKVIGDYELVQTQLRVKDGYLIRNVLLSSIKAEPAPPFEELQRFAQAEAADAAALASAATGTGPAVGSAVTQLAALAHTLGGYSGTTGTVSATGAAPAGMAASLATSFSVGDTVIVVLPGDLRNLTGTVHAVPADGDIQVAPADEYFGLSLLSFKPHDLAKFFAPGRHVRVTAGAHEGATGMVVSTTEDVAVIITDVLREECKVFMRHLVDAADATSSDAMLGEYALFDLALLADGVAGMVVQIERDGCIVLTHGGTPDRPEVRTLRLGDLQRKINPGRNTAQDGQMNALTKGDAATVVDGPRAGTTGIIQWIHRGYLFLKSRDVTDYAGCFCVRSKNVRIAGGGLGGGCGLGGNTSSSALARVLASPAAGAVPMSILRSPALQGGMGMLPSASAGARVLMNVPMSPRLDGGASRLAGSAPRSVMTPSGSAPVSVLSPGVFSGRRSMGGSLARQSDPLVGQRILVRSGAYKGYRGIVLDATESVVRLELEANEKTVTINRVHVDPSGQAALAPSTISAATAAAVAQTPSRDVYGRTPLHALGTPGRDPMATPGREGWAGFGATPARPAGAATPMRDATLLAPFPLAPGAYGGAPPPPALSGSFMSAPPAAPHLAPTPGAVPLVSTWVMPGMHVRVKDASGVSIPAIVRGIANLQCTVQLVTNGVQMTVVATQLEPEPPTKRGERVVVINSASAKLRGACGVVVLIAEDDIVVRLHDEPHDMKVRDTCTCE